MALTRLDRVGDGLTTTYDVTFDLGYLRKEYVYVYLSTNDYTTQLSYTWVNNSQIILSEPVPNGTEFHIRRIIPRDRIINNYEDGAILKESNLDNSFLQSIMILQEIQDGYTTVDGDFRINTTLDMENNPIINVATDEEDETSAVNLGFADDRFVNILGDVMQGQLGGLNATENNHFMPRLQISELIDARILTVPGKDTSLFEDFGLSSTTVGITDDYGTITVVSSETIDYGSI